MSRQISLFFLFGSLLDIFGKEIEKCLENKYPSEDKNKLNAYGWGTSSIKGIEKYIKYISIVNLNNIVQ